jgi:large subunit ribosomal protein L38
MFGFIDSFAYSLQLEKRTFQTLDFYRERQDDITPAGLAFYQSDWDRSLTDFFHNTLSKLKEFIISVMPVVQ